MYYFKSFSALSENNGLMLGKYIPLIGLQLPFLNIYVNSIVFKGTRVKPKRSTWLCICVSSLECTTSLLGFGN